MSDWTKAKKLATSVGIIGASSVLLGMLSDFGDTSTMKMIAQAIEVIRILAVPSIGLIVLSYGAIKLGNLSDDL